MRVGGRRGAGGGIGGNWREECSEILMCTLREGRGKLS